MTDCTQAAKEIRVELKELFPNTKFSVRSMGFSGGTAVDVYWADGPRVVDVRKVVDKYQYGHFDGMTDSYEHSNRREDIHQAKFVSVHREMSDEVKEKVIRTIVNDYTGWEVFEENEYNKHWGCYGTDMLWKVFGENAY